MDKKATASSIKEQQRINLNVLQRIDPFISCISHSASQVALYKFESSKWDKTDIAGTLFVYERQCEPKAGFIILNRMSPNNWIQPIKEKLELQLQKHLLYYKTEEGKIYGIWFYDNSECKAVSSALDRHIGDLLPKNLNSFGNKKFERENNLAQLLLRAQKSPYILSDADPKPIPLTPKRKPTIDDPDYLEHLCKVFDQEVSAANMKPGGLVDPTSLDSVTAFFAQAVQEEKNSQSLQMAEGNKPLPPGPGTTPEEIEQGLRSLIINLGLSNESECQGNSQSFGDLPPMPSQAQKADDLEADLKNKKIRKKKGKRVAQVQSPPVVQGMTYGAALTSGNAEEAALADQMGAALLQQSMGNQTGEASQLQTQQQPQHDLQHDLMYDLLQKLKPQPDPVTKPPSIELLSPTVFNTLPLKHSQGDAGHIYGPINPLTKFGLVKALEHLLKTDADFVNKLHQAYTDSLNDKSHH